MLSLATQHVISGTVGSPGQAYGLAYILRDLQVTIPRRQIDSGEIPHQISRFRESLGSVITQLQAWRDQSEEQEKKDIFSGYVLLLDDPELAEAIESEIADSFLTAEAAVDRVMESHAASIGAFSDPYLRERATDVRDLSKRLIRQLLGIANPDQIALDDDVILIAHDLTPAQFVQLDSKRILGIVTEAGGQTSHTSILARSLGIPAIVGTAAAMSRISAQDKVLVDANSNRILINPDHTELEDFFLRQAAWEAKQENLQALKNEFAETRDGLRLSLLANIALPMEIERVLGQGAEGIGLFRSEFLFMDRSTMPSEEEQFQAYRLVLEGMQGRSTVIRTLDVGGDKDLPYLDLPQEDNPYLGCRGIRIGLRHPATLLTQLRALIRASHYGKLKIMFPMLASVEEIRAIHALVEKAQEQLTEAGNPPAGSFQLGIMIETPAAVVMADKLLKYVDFFSIGTNDLTQYILAVDRGNTHIADLYQTFSPAVLRSIKHVIDMAQKHGKDLSVCGELAGSKEGALLLVGLGVKELSMAASSISQVKMALRGSRYQDLQKWAAAILECETVADVREKLQEIDAP